MEYRKSKSGLIAKLANYVCLYGYFIAAKKHRWVLGNSRGNTKSSWTNAVQSSYDIADILFEKYNQFSSWHGSHVAKLLTSFFPIELVNG